MPRFSKIEVEEILAQAKTIGKERFEDTIAPEQPKQPTVTVHAQMVVVTCKQNTVKSTDLSGFEIWRNTTNTSQTAVKVGWVDCAPTQDFATWADTSAQPGATYYYWTIARDIANNASPFSPASTPLTVPLVTGGEAMPPDAPTGVSVETAARLMADGTVSVYNKGVFTPGARTLFTRVEVGEGITPSVWTELASVSNGTWLHEPVKSGVLYSYRVTCVNTGGASAAVMVSISAGNYTNSPGTGQAPLLELFFKSVAVVCRQDATKVPNLAGFEIWRNTVAITGTAIKVGFQPCSGALESAKYLDDTTGYGITYYYWTKLVDTNGNVGDFSAVSASVTTQGIIAGDIATGALNSSALFAAGVVDAAAIADRAVTAVKTNLAAINSTTGCINACMVGSTQLVDSAVSSVKLADAAVTAAKTNLAAISSSTGNLNAGTVGTTQVVDCAIATAKLAAGAVTCPKIAAGAIYACHVSAGAIEAGAIKAGAICTCHIVATGISGTCITAYSITATQLATANLITLSAQICDAIIVNSKIACLDAGKINTGTLAAARIATGSLSADKIIGTALVVGGAAGDVNSGSTCICGDRIVTGSITALQIAACAITSEKIISTGITGACICAGTITASHLLVATTGSALNEDPSFYDATAWSNTSAIVSITDGKVGSFALTYANEVFNTRYIPIEASKSYRVHAWIKSSSGGDRAVIIRLQYYGDNCTSIGDCCVNAYYGVPASTWTEVNTIIQPPAAAKYAKFRLFSHYSGTTGQNWLQDVRLEEVLPGTLIQDGAITTEKILANSICSGHICTGGISGACITAGSITADRLNVGCLEAISTKIGSWTIGGTYLCSAVNAGVVYLNSAVPSIYTAASCGVGSYAMHGRMLWANAWQNAFGFSVTNGITGPLAAGMGFANSSAVTLPDSSTVAQGCPFFWVGDSSNYVKYYDGTLSVRGDIVVPDGSITTTKLANGIIGGALNEDPYFCCASNIRQSPASYQCGYALATVTDGIVGNRVLRTNDSWQLLINCKLIPVQAGKQYRISAYVRAVTTASNVYPLTAHYYSTGAESDVDSWNPGVIVTTTSWQYYSRLVTVPAGKQFMRISIHQNSDSTATEYQDLRVEEAVTNDKIASGAIAGLTMTSTALYSSDYVAGTAGKGFCINSAGKAEFNNVTVRGTVCATAGCFTGTVTATSGCIGCLEICNSYLCRNKYIGGICHEVSLWHGGIRSVYVNSNFGSVCTRKFIWDATQSGSDWTNPPLIIDITTSTCWAACFNGKVQAVAFTTCSDRIAKENISVVTVLPKIRQLSIMEWSFKGDPDRRIGPMAQDVFRMFPFHSKGSNVIGSLDGIALKGVQELDGCVGCLQSCIRYLESRLANIEARLIACA